MCVERVSSRRKTLQPCIAAEGLPTKGSSYVSREQVASWKSTSNRSRCEEVYVALISVNRYIEGLRRIFAAQGQQQHQRLRRTIHISLVPDEEVGGADGELS